MSGFTIVLLLYQILNRYSKFFGIIIVFVIIILLLLQLYDLSCMYLRTYTDIVYELNFQL